MRSGRLHLQRSADSSLAPGRPCTSTSRTRRTSIGTGGLGSWSDGRCCCTGGRRPRVAMQNGVTEFIGHHLNTTHHEQHVHEYTHIAHTPLPSLVPYPFGTLLSGRNSRLDLRNDTTLIVIIINGCIHCLVWCSSYAENMATLKSTWWIQLLVISHCGYLGNLHL